MNFFPFLFPILPLLIPILPLILSLPFSYLLININLNTRHLYIFPSLKLLNSFPNPFLNRKAYTFDYQQLINFSFLKLLNSFPTLSLNLFLSPI